MLVVLTGCLLEIVTPQKTVTVHNPTSEPVKISCGAFTGAKQDILLQAYSFTEFTIDDFNNSILIFEQGYYFENASESFLTTGRYNTITLNPNCSTFEIYNRTGSTLRFVQADSVSKWSYAWYDSNGNLDFRDEVIVYNGETRVIKIVDKYPSFQTKISFLDLYDNSYETKVSYTIPNKGSTSQITLTPYNVH